MAQDTTPAIEVYQGDGSNNTFSVHFDKGYYGEIKVAFVKRGLTDYEYDPDTYTVSGRLYAWVFGDSAVYTHTPNPAIGAHIYTEQDVDTGTTVAEISGITITFDGRTYTRAQQHDIYDNVILTWTGDTLQVGDYICIVRETERGQPYELPINQKQIEGALDNIERQVQELKAKTDNALLVDPTRIADVSLMGPVQWMETILRSIDLSVRELRYYDGWLQYSLDDPKSASEDKTWYSLLNTTNIKSIYYKYTEDEQGRPLYNVYYVDNTNTERLLTYDAQAQRDDIDKLKQDVEANRQSIEGEKTVRRAADEELRRYIDEKALQVDQFDGRITQNEEDIADIQSKIDPTASAADPLVPKSYVDNQVAGIYHIKGVVDTVEDLPTTGNMPGDCYNVLEDRQTYIWTEAEEWAATGEVVDLTLYRTAGDQDVIDAGKQGKLTAGDYIEIATGDVINMTGKFGSSFDMNGKNLILKDQDGNTLDETLIGIGVDAEYTPAEEDIEFNESEGGDISFITERLNAIEEKIPDDASSSNKFATADDIGDATLTIQRNNTTVDTFSANATENKTINIAVPTTAAEVDALPDTTKYAANMSLSINSSTYVVTAQLKDQDGNNLGSAQTIDLPLETVVVSGSYDSENKKIVLTLKDGSTIDIPVGDLIAGLQAEITDSNKLSADLVDDTTTTHKFVTTQDKTNWDNKVTKTTAVSKVYGTDNAGAQTTYDVDSFGAVDDVKVDNVSVVTNKIANIDLTGKQNKLIPGANITIENDVISAAGAAVPTFATIEGSPYDNTNLATELNKKITQDDSLSLFPVGEEEEHVGEIRQYIGPDYPSNKKFHGYFYQWTRTQLGPSSYSYGWEQCNVQPEGAVSIATLTDVSLTSLADGNALIYDANSGKWTNGTGGVSASYDSTTKTITFA